MGMGDEPTKEDWNNLAKQSSGQFQEAFASSKGYVKGAMDGNNLSSDYKQGVESQSAKKVATTAEYGSRIDTGTAIESGKRSGASMAGVDMGNLSYSASEHAKVAETQTRSKIESTLGGIKGAGSEDQYVKDSGTKAEGMAKANREAISRADKKYDGGYVGLQADQSAIKTDQAIGNTAGMMEVMNES